LESPATPAAARALQAATRLLPVLALADEVIE
jgi:hypothetical protein